MHDKCIWNDAYGATKSTLKQIVLADKAYVGAKGEGELLLRPHRRSEAAYKADKDSAKAFNRALSKGRELAGERRHHSVKVEHVFAQMKHSACSATSFRFTRSATAKYFVPSRSFITSNSSSSRRSTHDDR